MGYKAVPDDGVKGFGMGGDATEMNCRNYDHVVTMGSGVSAVAADDAKYLESTLLGFTHTGDEIRTDVVLCISSTHRENEDRIL